MEKTLLITGSTGLVGGNLLPLVLRDNEIKKLYLLVRGKNYNEALEKVHNTINQISPDTDKKLINEKVNILLGDVSYENLGFEDSDYNRVSKEVTHIIHSAANVNFLQTEDSARKNNLNGTQNVMKLASAAKSNGILRRVAYISTAYVFGNRAGTIYENQSYSGTDFANSYEHSKFEADSYVRSLSRELPVTIFRPSIIVGNSRTGVTTAFNVLYVPLELIFRGLLNFIPGNKNTIMDVVPVDFVSKAIYHILFKTGSSSGRIYHLTSGKVNSITAGEIIELAIKFSGQINDEYAISNIKNVKFIPLNAFKELTGFVRGSARKIYQAMEIFAPYLSVKRFFDNSNTSEALQGSGISIPCFKDFYFNLFNYCVETNWGRMLRSAA